MKNTVSKICLLSIMASLQVIAFCALYHQTNAASNEIIITCPSEASASNEISCNLTIKTSSKIRNVTATATLSNLKIKKFEPASGWTSSNSGTSTLIDISSSTDQPSGTKIGTLTLITTVTDQSSTINFENITFKNSDSYSFNAISSGAEIKITSSPTTPTCTDDEELVDGKCVKKTPTCAEDEELVNGECIQQTETCDDDEELVDGKCVKKTPTCAEDEELVNGECIQQTETCDDDEELVDGKCVKKTPTCAEDEVLKNNECVKKVTTPTCKSDEILENNICVKKPSEIDPLLIALIIGGIVLVIAIIILLVVFMKKKKNSDQSGFLGANGKRIKNSKTVAPQGFTKEDFERFGISSGQQAQTGGYNQPVQQTTTAPYENGSFMSRTGEVTTTNMAPKENTDPRFSMKIENPNQNMSAENTTPNNPLTSEIERGNIIKTYDDPRLQYNFSQTQQVQAPTPTQSQIPQAPIVSAYDIATQAAAQPQQEPQEVIQAAPVAPQQPIAPVYNPQTQQTQQQTTVYSQYQTTTSVPLTAPNDPTIFES